MENTQAEQLPQEKSLEEVKKDYRRNAHRMQAGVAYKMNYDSSETSPKHLRVGINSALSDQAALAELLIQKGIISQDEYVRAIAGQMKKEADNYELEIQSKLGPNVKLDSLY
jgi:hypothetical protein